MCKFSINAQEMMEELDKICPNSYDKLQAALESKVLSVLSEKKWLEIWESGNFSIELSINFDLPKELKK
jgi:hypothetical protein